jgi:hypothetical protein
VPLGCACPYSKPSRCSKLRQSASDASLSSVLQRSMVDRDRPTPRQSSSLQRAPDFAAHAIRIARDASELVSRYTTPPTTHIRGALGARRLRDAASQLAVEFQSWGTKSTTSDDRIAAIRRLSNLQRILDGALMKPAGKE